MGPVNLVSVYVPTLQEIEDNVELEVTVKSILNREQLYLFGNFNARVGTDDDSWQSCVGRLGHWLQLDLIIAQAADLRGILETCSLHSYSAQQYWDGFSAFAKKLG